MEVRESGESLAEHRHDDFRIQLHQHCCTQFPHHASEREFWHLFVGHRYFLEQELHDLKSISEGTVQALCACRHRCSVSNDLRRMLPYGQGFRCSHWEK